MTSNNMVLPKTTLMISKKYYDIVTTNKHIYNARHKYNKFIKSLILEMQNMMKCLVYDNYKYRMIGDFKTI